MSGFIMTIELQDQQEIQLLELTGSKVTYFNGRDCDMDISELPDTVIDELLARGLIKPR